MMATANAARLATRISGRLAVYGRERLQTFWRYARVEMRPPLPADIPEIQRGFREVVQSFRTGRWREFTVKEAWLNTLITLEIAFWFFMGEIIGRGHFRGYYIPPE